MPLLFILLTFTTLSFGSDFQKISINGLDFDYTAPYGKGTVEKVGIGFGLQAEVYPVEVTKSESSYEVTSPFIDLSWSNPWKFVFDLEKLSTKKTSLSLGWKDHFIRSEFVSATPLDRGDYKGFGIDGTCKGESVGKDFQTRLMEDCREEGKVSIKKLDIPTDFILYKVVYDLPQVPSELDIPADDFLLTAKKGDFALTFYMKYVFYAGLRAWGHFQYEDNYNTVAIRVDQIKFGYFSVTGMVMKRLKEIIKSPRVKVDPPWIRVDISRENESRKN